jgi:hypothetical protein
MKTRLSLVAFLLLALFLVPLAAWGQQAELPLGTAKGTFTGEGKAIALRHAYALIKPNKLDDDEDALYLVLSDVPVTPDMLREEWGLAEAFRDGKLNAIELRLDQNKAPACGQLYHPAFADGSVSVCGIAKLDLGYFDGKRISGRLYTGKEESFGKQWEFSAQFSAAILPKPKPVAEVMLPLDSPPAQLALAFVKAARAGDKAGLKKVITSEMAADLDGPNGAKIMEFLKEAYPPTMKLTKVVKKGEHKAEIVFTEKSKDSSATTTMKAALVNGAWILTK